MNKKRVEIRWKRHHEKQEWQKEAEEAIDKGLEEVKPSYSKKRNNLSNNQ